MTDNNLTPEDALTKVRALYATTGAPTYKLAADTIETQAHRIAELESALERTELHWRQELEAYKQSPPPNDELRRAAQAVVDRWDTPLWKDVPATATYINALRAALSAREPVTVHKCSFVGCTADAKTWPGLCEEHEYKERCKHGVRWENLCDACYESDPETDDSNGPVVKPDGADAYRTGGNDKLAKAGSNPARPATDETGERKPIVLCTCMGFARHPQECSTCTPTETKGSQP